MSKRKTKSDAGKLLLPDNQMFSGVVAIDPGSSSGAICVWTSRHKDMIYACNMPDSMESIWILISGWADEMRASGENILWVTENVGGSRPGNAAKSARTFAEHVGALRMALIASDVSPKITITPQMWMYSMYGTDASFPRGTENKDKRKQYIYETMLKRWPTNSKFTKRQADAVALATWAIDTLKASNSLEVDNVL